MQRFENKASRCLRECSQLRALKMGTMKHTLTNAILALSICYLAAACRPVTSQHTTGPKIRNIATSSKVLAKSDCIPTSLSVSADISDDEDVKSVTLRYRIGAGQDFAATDMKYIAGDQYEATIVALDIPGGQYGVLEFFITAKDSAGHETKSNVDMSVELLPCVAS
jgi:hypothetical protein